MPPTTTEQFRQATPGDALELAALHTAVADDLTTRFGRGHWSTRTRETGVVRALRTTHVCIATVESAIVATFQLTTKKPWAIDAAYFAPFTQSLYLLSMAVLPSHQRQGIGTRVFAEAIRLARAFPADTIRLDAYDCLAGAGDFYAKCGCAEVGRVIYRQCPLRYFEYRLR